MRLQVKGRNLDVTDSIRSYAEQKLKKLDKQLNDATEIELELAVEKNPSIAANQIAEATVWTKGPTLRAREASEDMRASIDQLTEKLVRQVRHYRDKRSYRGARNQVPVDEGVPALENDQLEQQIVKTKQFPDKPMNSEEAVLQLELIGHDFFVFRNADTGEVNVVYRRKDGGYGLIEPGRELPAAREAAARTTRRGGRHDDADRGHARRRAVEPGRRDRHPTAASMGRRRRRRGRPSRGLRPLRHARGSNRGRRRGRPGRPARAACRRRRDAAEPPVPRRGHEARRPAVGGRCEQDRSRLDRARRSAATRSSSPSEKES